MGLRHGRSLLRAAFGDYPRIELWAQNGQAQLLGRDHVWQELRWATMDSAEVRHLAAAPEQLGQTRYTHGLQRFIEAVRTGSPSPVSLQEAVLSVDVAMAVTASARTRQPVEIPNP